MISKRWLYLFAASLLISLVFAVSVRLPELQRFLDGQRDTHSVVAVFSLCWLALVCIAAVAVARSLFTVRRTLFRRDQTIAAVASTTHDWLWESDTKHVLTYCSRGVEDLLGFRPEELVGACRLDLLVESERERAVQVIAKALIDGTGWEGLEALWLHRDGHPVALNGSAAAILDESGRVIGLRGTLVRITDAVRAEREAAVGRRRLELVLETHALDIALQPIVSLASGRLAGVEALARFRDGRGPDAWFRDARESGQAKELDQLAFNTALKLFSALPESCYLSVNASPALIMDSGFAARLLDSSLPLHRLVIEITEHVAISDYDVQNEALKSLRERGVRLAVDDTGAGYASLSHVLQLRPDIIKIDRSLIARLATDPARRSLVTALVLLALDIGATVTGEGVEEAAELETLATLGVGFAQGYFLARPTTDRRSWDSWADQEWPVDTGARVESLAESSSSGSVSPPR